MRRPYVCSYAERSSALSSPGPATLFAAAAGTGTVAASAAALAEGVLQTMFMTRRKSVVILAMVSGLLAGESAQSADQIS
jgi:hypothetical protein